jgi:quercetin dioxygenase-like cupin family protein
MGATLRFDPRAAGCTDLPHCRRCRHREVVVTHGTFEEFEAEARVQGFDEVLERRWPPGTVLETHTHPFALRALVVAGEMWLTVGNDVRHLRPGDAFALDRDLPHAERYGADGATYRVARRTAAASG